MACSVWFDVGNVGVARPDVWPPLRGRLLKGRLAHAVPRLCVCNGCRTAGRLRHERNSPDRMVVRLLAMDTRHASSSWVMLDGGDDDGRVDGALCLLGAVIDMLLLQTDRAGRQVETMRRRVAELPVPVRADPFTSSREKRAIRSDSDDNGE